MASKSQPDYEIRISINLRDFAKLAGLETIVSIVFDKLGKHFSSIVIIPDINEFPSRSDLTITGVVLKNWIEISIIVFGLLIR